MIFGIIGNLGAGKTLSLTALGLKMSDMFEQGVIVSNYSVDYADMYVENPVELEELSKQEQGLQMLDEVWAWADSRNSGNNELFNEMVINSRKRGWVVGYTTQDLHMIDKRLRDNTDYIILPSHSSKPTGDEAKIDIFTWKGLQHVRTITYNPEALYGIYDTTEEVGTSNKGNHLEKFIDKAEEMLEKPSIEYKKDIVAELVTEEDISKGDAELVATKVMNNAEEA